MIPHDSTCKYCFLVVTDNTIDRFSNTTLRRKLPKVNPNDMRQCEREAYDRLPDRFTAYRGYATFQKISKSKLMTAQSWTTDRWTAQVLMDAHITHLKRLTPYTKGVKINSVLETREVNKDEVLAVCLRRNEYEIILVQQGE